MTHYFDIDATFSIFADCPAAVEYLSEVIDQQSPDRFHWSVLNKALDICITGKAYVRAEPDYNEECGWLGHCDQSTLC